MKSSWCWQLSAVLSLIVCPAAPVAAQLDPVISVSTLPGREFTQGETLGINLSLIPPVDAPGEVTVLVDGLGTVDGFVQRMWTTTRECTYGGSDCVPCPPGRVCFRRPLQLDVRAALGRTTFPITIVDARGRETRTSASVDVRPALDRDADGLPDVWEDRYQLSPRNGDGPADDPNGNGVSNLDEFRRGTNPRARYFRYFAEGSTGDRGPGLEQCFQMVDIDSEPGGVWFTVIGDGGRRLETHRNGGLLCPLDRAEHPADRVVAVLVESERPAAVERVAVATGDLPFATTGVPAPSTRWLFADGGTDGLLDTFYLAYNPGAAPVEARITYRGPNGAALRTHTRVLPPGARTTTWVNADDAPLGRAEAWVAIEAAAPILVERAWRFNPPGRTVTHAYASPGTDDASTRWIFPEVDGGGAFATTIVLANPDTRAAVLNVNLLFGDRDTRMAGQVRVPPRGRITLPAAAILPDLRASVEIVSDNGVGVIAERAFNGRDASGPWRSATVGARESADAWMLANVDYRRDRELVLTNMSAFPAKVELHFYAAYSFAADVVTTIEIPARRRLVYPLPADRSTPWVDGTLRVTSQLTDRGTAEVVVEALRFIDVGGVARARGAGVLGSRTQ